ncbi:MAG TPA: histidine phosphatase family protein [Candidatus Saccharimonadales bacterium]|nr:histidine phosphatase family protein [Candidatus Saccharimonadales bacterium]
MHIYLRHGDDTNKKSKYKHDKSLNVSKKTEYDIVKTTKKLIKLYGYPDRIYCSPFKRCRETLDIILKVVKNAKVVIDSDLSRFFVKKEYIHPSVRHTTMYYDPPIKESHKEFKKRVERNERRVIKHDHDVTWCITHYLVMKCLCKKYQILLPDHMPFLYHFVL